MTLQVRMLVRSRGSYQAQASAGVCHRRAVSASAIKRRLAEIDRSTVAGAQDYALIAVVLATGRRLSELALLDWRDVMLQDNGRVQLTWRRMKGGKVGRDLLTTSVSAALITYLHQMHGAAVGTLDAIMPVWVSLASNYPGGRLTRQAIANICRDRLGVSKVHSLRHTFARAMEQAGAKRKPMCRPGSATPVSPLPADIWPRLPAPRTSTLM